MSNPAPFVKIRAGALKRYDAQACQFVEVLRRAKPGLFAKLRGQARRARFSGGKRMSPSKRWRIRNQRK